VWGAGSARRAGAAALVATAGLVIPSEPL